MSHPELARFAGWSAVASAIVTVVGIVTLVMFFTVGQPWGTINDPSSIILAIAVLPVLLVLHRLHRADAPNVSFATLVMAVLAMMVAILFQGMLVIEVITFEQTAVVVPAAFGVLGAALMRYASLALRGATWPRGLAVWGMFAGGGYVLTIVGFLLRGEDHPLTTVGGALAVLSYPVWAVWFGRLLLTRRLTVNT